MAYIGTSPSNGVRRVHTYTATANQTTFTGSSTEGVTLTYADTNYIDVFQNGVLLGSADYTSTSGTSVVLAQGASVSDLVVIVVYDVFSVADTVSKTSGGSFDSAVTMSGGLKVADGGNIGSASDTDAMAISSGGVVTFSQTPIGNFIGMADQFRLTGTTNDGSNADVTSNIERIHTTGQGTLGTGMTESSGIFSFPSTGIYLVMFNVDFTIGGSENNAFCNLQVTTNNSSYTTIASANSGSQDGSHGASGTGMSLIDVTNTSNVKVKFTTSSMNSGSSLIGSEDQNRTTFTFIKLGIT